MCYLAAHILASLGLEFSLLPIHCCILISFPLSLHSFNCYPFYRVTFSFWFSEGLMTTDGGFSWTMLMGFVVLFWADYIFKNYKRIFFVHYDQFAQNWGVGAFSMLGPRRDTLHRGRVLQSQVACTMTNFPI